MIARILHAQSKNVAFSANLLAVSSLISAILGLLRDRLLGGHFGAGVHTDVYLAAFRIPDLVYGIFILGGISIAFLPLFSELFEKDPKKAWEFSSNLLNVLSLGLVVCSVILVFASPLLLPFVAPGFADDQKTLAVNLMRLMFLSPILFGISSVFSGIIQYHNRFLAYALAPILYNLGIIGGIIFLVPVFGIWGAGVGVVAGALLYLFVQVPSAIHSGFRWKAVFRIADPSLVRVFGLALPRLPGAIAYHMNLIIMTALASLFSAGSITVFGFANNLQSFPINIIGVSFAIAVFPILSRAFVKKNLDQFRSSFRSSFSEIVFLVLPLGTFLFLLRAQIIRLVYGVGKFGWEDTRLTAAVLGIFTFGILFQALIPLLARAFFSLQNTKIPTVAGLFGVGLNLLLAFAFIHFLSFENVFQKLVVSVLHLEDIQDIRVLALPFALMLSGLFQCITLIVVLEKRVHQLFMKGFLSIFLKIGLSTLALGSATYTVLFAFGTSFALRTFWEVFFQTFLAISAGSITFLLCARFLKIPQLETIFRSLRQQLYGK